MKVTISVPGRFHAFDLAKQLQKKSSLKQLITSYPVLLAKKFGILPSLVSSIFSKELIYRGYRRISGRYPDGSLLNEWFDFVASWKINFDSDIYVIWSGFASRTIRRIRSKNPGARIILERGSTHIVFQDEILRHAYQFFPELKPSLPDRQVIDKELREYAACDYIAVPTDFAKETFVEKGVPADKLIVVPYGVDLSSFTPKKTSSPHIKEILFVGNFSVRKGARVFIDILERSQDNQAVHFHIVGGIETGLLNYLQPFIESGLLAYTPHVPQQELNGHYHQADIFLFPSLEEGMAMVLLQALACGLCVIASPNSGAGMLIRHGENGFLAGPEDVEGILDLIGQLLVSDALRDRVGKNARQSVESDFSWDGYGRKIIGRYQEILQ